MPSRLLTVLVLVVGSTPLAARTAVAQAQAYGVAGPAGFAGVFGSSASDFHAAGGGEVLFGGRVGGGVEFGALGNASSALLVFSANGVVQVRRASRGPGVSPFVTFGYTHMSSGEGGFDAWNLGGGVNWWMRDRVGVRMEFRDHVRPDDRGTVQYWSFRAGVCFR